MCDDSTDTTLSDISIDSSEEIPGENQIRKFLQQEKRIHSLNGDKQLKKIPKKVRKRVRYKVRQKLHPLKKKSVKQRRPVKTSTDKNK